MNLQTIKKKYFIETDKEIAIGKADEIRWLISELEKAQQEFATLSESVTEGEVIIEQLHKEIEQYKLKEQYEIERSKMYRDRIFELKRMTGFKVYEENLRLAQEIARMKGTVI